MGEGYIGCDSDIAVVGLLSRRTFDGIFILWALLTGHGRRHAHANRGLEFQTVCVEEGFAPIGLMPVPTAALDVVMLVQAGRRPAISRSRIVDFPIGLFRSKSRVLGWQTEER